MASNYVNIPPNTGGGGGAVDSVNGQTGIVTITADQLIPGSFDFFIKKDSGGIVTGSDTVYENSSGGIVTQINNLEVSDNTTYNGFSVNASLDIQENSPASSVNMINLYINGGNAFTLGTGGTALRGIASTIDYSGTANVGSLEGISTNFVIGNDVDPITSKGLAYAFGFGVVRDNVTLDGPLQGYTFQPNVEAGAFITNNMYVNAFTDGSQILSDCNSYTSANLSPTIDNITNNSNLTSININPTVTTFSGNSTYNGVALSGDLGTFDTGNYNGIFINQTASSVDNATGIYVNMSNITATNKKAADFTGDVSINGSLSFTGALSIGQLNAFATQAVIDGGGAPTSINSLVSAPTIAANAVTANADTLGINTAMLLTAGDNSTTTTGFIGLAALALPAVVTMGTGSTIDKISGAAFAISLDPGATGGTIDEVSLCRAVAIPNGVTAITDLMGFKMDLPFGDPGTTSWGVYITPSINNYMAGNLLLGGTAGSDDTVTNSSVALEIKSTTGAFVASRMTTTERNALTAVNGMILYNTTTDKLQVYAAGSWVDLH
jgi:hypothetical protein